MKKNYITPYAEMNAIASRDVITLSWGNQEKTLMLEELENQEREMKWDWIAK